MWVDEEEQMRSNFLIKKLNKYEIFAKLGHFTG